MQWFFSKSLQGEKEKNIQIFLLKFKILLSILSLTKELNPIELDLKSRGSPSDEPEPRKKNCELCQKFQFFK